MESHQFAVSHLWRMVTTCCQDHWWVPYSMLHCLGNALTTYHLHRIVHILLSLCCLLLSGKLAPMIIDAMISNDIQGISMLFSKLSITISQCTWSICGVGTFQSSSRHWFAILCRHLCTRRAIPCLQCHCCCSCHFGLCCSAWFLCGAIFHFSFMRYMSNYLFGSNRHWRAICTSPICTAWLQDCSMCLLIHADEYHNTKQYASENNQAYLVETYLAFD